jgi:hypothetical protein
VREELRVGTFHLRQNPSGVYMGSMAKVLRIIIQGWQAIPLSILDFCGFPKLPCTSTGDGIRFPVGANRVAHDE